MQLRSKDDCSEEYNSPSQFVKRRVQNAVVLGLEVADRMVKTTLKQWESNSTPFTWHPNCT